MAITRVRFNEQSSAFIRSRMVDQDGEIVEPVDLTGATLTLWDVDSGNLHVSPSEGILNSRDHQDILNGSAFDNDVTYESDGYFRWDLQPEDNVIVNTRRQVERHRAMFVFTWDGGALTYEVEIEVVNLRKAV